jgi:hypothetical protein
MATWDDFFRELEPTMRQVPYQVSKFHFGLGSVLVLQR